MEEEQTIGKLNPFTNQSIYGKLPGMIKERNTPITPVSKQDPSYSIHKELGDTLAQKVNEFKPEAGSIPDNMTTYSPAKNAGPTSSQIAGAATSSVGFLTNVMAADQNTAGSSTESDASTMNLVSQGLSTGTSLGSTIGTLAGPGGTAIGAGIGAGVGAISGLVMGSFNKSRDKKRRLRLLKKKREESFGRKVEDRRRISLMDDAEKQIDADKSAIQSQLGIINNI